MFDENSNNVMAMINHLMNVKDSRWLQVEVCREFQRGQCSRTDQECKFAHPQAFVEVQNGRVTACYDSIKGRCTRENPKCKYLHPPQHIKDQLLINGRNALALKNLLMSQLNGQTPGTPANAAAAVNPLVAGTTFMPGGQPGGALAGVTGLPAGTAMAAYPYYFNQAALYSPGAQGFFPAAASPEVQSVGVGPTVSPASLAAVQQAQQKARTDRVEVCREFVRGACQRQESDCKFAHPPTEVEKANDGTVTVCMDFVRSGGREGGCQRAPCRYFHPPNHILTSVRAKLQSQANGEAVAASNGNSAGLLTPVNGNMTTAGLLAACANGQGLFLDDQTAAAYANSIGQPMIINGNSNVHHNSLPASAASLAMAAVHAAASHSSMGSVTNAVSQTPPVMSNAVAQAVAAAQQIGPGGSSLLSASIGSSLNGSTDTQQTGGNGNRTNNNNNNTGLNGNGIMSSNGISSSKTGTAADCQVVSSSSNSSSNTAAMAAAQAAAARSAQLIAASTGTGVLQAQRGKKRPYEHDNTESLQNAVAGMTQSYPDPGAAASGLQMGALINSPAAYAQAVAAQQQQQIQQQIQQQQQQQQQAAVVGGLSPSFALGATGYQSLAGGQWTLPAGNGLTLPAAYTNQPGQTDPLLLAAAALQQQQQQQQQAQASAVKRVAVEKSGVPVYQPATQFGVSQANQAALQYQAQFSIPGLGAAAYIPTVTFPPTALVAPGGGMSNQQLTIPGTNFPSNANSVAYFDETGQLLDTLPVCRDFKAAHCERPNCRYVHLLEDFVEVHEGKVTVCRDFAKGKCSRVMCKYYHVPVLPGSMFLSRLNPSGLQPGVAASAQQPLAMYAAASGVPAAMSPSVLTRGLTQDSVGNGLAFTPFNPTAAGGGLDPQTAAVYLTASQNQSTNAYYQQQLALLAAQEAAVATSR